MIFLRFKVSRNRTFTARSFDCGSFGDPEATVFNHKGVGVLLFPGNCLRIAILMVIDPIVSYIGIARGFLRK